MQIMTSYGGFCIYKRGILPDGTQTGRVQYLGQPVEQLKSELMETIKTGRDDVKSFVNTLTNNRK